MQLNTRLGCLYLIILSLLMSACHEDASADYPDSACHKITAPGNYKNVCDINVTEDSLQAKILIVFELTSGSINWALRDPNGVIQKEGHADSWSMVIEEHSIDYPISGSWKLEFNLKNSQGEYSTYWEVQ